MQFYRLCVPYDKYNLYNLSTLLNTSNLLPNIMMQTKAGTLQNILIFAIIFISFPNEVPADYNYNSEWLPIRTTKLRRISPFSLAPPIIEAWVPEDSSQPGVGTSCATIFQDGHFKGQSQSFMFPGSTGQIDVGNGQRQRIRSIYVKDGCGVTLWGSHPNSDLSLLSFTESTSFIATNATNNFEWGCCYCDQCSENVCSSAIQASAAKTPAVPSPDFSQFVRYGKKILAVGLNYRKNKKIFKPGKEYNLKFKTINIGFPNETMIVIKPTTAYVTEGQPIQLPQSLGEILHEIELGVVIGKKGKNIHESQALDYVAGYFLALDMTAGQYIINRGNYTFPWTVAKGFDTACAVSDFVPKSLVPDPNNLELECSVNGEVKQSANTGEMILNVHKIISDLSRYMTLEPFDTILTGTPDGFSPVKGGDVIQGRLGDLTSFEFETVSIAE